MAAAGLDPLVSHGGNIIGIEAGNGIGWEWSSGPENECVPLAPCCARSRYDMEWLRHGRSLALREYHESSDEFATLGADSPASIDLKFEHPFIASLIMERKGIKVTDRGRFPASQLASCAACPGARHCNDLVILL
jgi:hypothetical protein